MKDDQRVSTKGGDSLGHNPFGGLEVGAFWRGEPPAPKAEAGKTPKPVKTTARRVDVRREKSGRGGKTVTVIAGLGYLGAAEREQLARELRRSLGVGGAVKGGSIELQGDQRDALETLLPARGLRPVRTGG